MNAVVNLLPTIAPKSDQLNADDLIGGRTLTITVSKVRLCGEPDQPIAIHFEGDDGKPFKPCKSMRRVLVQLWGSDGNEYVGKRMTLYRDDKVLFGGMAVGGIRISHLSGIDREVTLALTATKASRKPFTVKPLGPDKAGASNVSLPAILAVGEAAAQKGSVALTAWWRSLSRAEQAAAKSALDERLKPIAAKADQAAMDEPADTTIGAEDADDGDFPGDRPARTPAGFKTGRAPQEEQDEQLGIWAADLIAEIPDMDQLGLDQVLSDPAANGKFQRLAAVNPDRAEALNRLIDRRQQELAR